MRLALLAVYVSFLAWANAFGSKSAHPLVAAGVRGVVTRLDAVTEVTSCECLLLSLLPRLCVPVALNCIKLCPNLSLLMSLSCYVAHLPGI